VDAVGPACAPLPVALLMSERARVMGNLLRARALEEKIEVTRDARAHATGARQIGESAAPASHDRRVVLDVPLAGGTERLHRVRLTGPRGRPRLAAGSVLDTVSIAEDARACAVAKKVGSP
jgi:hypothetical protein